MKKVLLSLMALFFVVACDDNPDKATVHGTITFKNVSVWKPSGSLTKADVDSGLVEVTIFADSVWKNVGGVRVPYGAPSNANNPVILTRVANDSTYEYSIDVEPGIYSALAVGFRTNRNVTADKKTATLGVYFGYPDSVSSGLLIPPFLNNPAPLPITVKKGEEKHINFKADFGFVNQWFQ